MFKKLSHSKKKYLILNLRKNTTLITVAIVAMNMNLHFWAFKRDTDEKLKKFRKIKYVKNKYKSNKNQNKLFLLIPLVYYSSYCRDLPPIQGSGWDDSEIK